MPFTSAPSSHRAPRSRRVALAACGLCAALAAGCDNGGIGDPPSTPIKDEYGRGMCPTDPSGVDCHLCNIVGPATWENTSNSQSVNCNSPPNTPVVVTGTTVVAIDTFDETMDGKSIGDIYAEDTSCNGMPYSGIQVFDPTFSPPALRLAEGDVVDLNGLYEEFLGPTDKPDELFGDCYSLPEFTGTLVFRFDSIGLPAPVEITAADLIGYDHARPYLGMLVTMKNVTLSAAGTNSEGRFTAPIDVGPVLATQIPYIDNELYDLQNDGPPLNAGETFASVTGILTYFYQFHIAPRSPADFVLETPDGGAGGSGAGGGGTGGADGGM